jgi:N-acetylglucosamine kinase-like BadF-type ATPase
VVTGNYVVGVDGGASKTVALVGTVEGTILGRGETGSSNYHNVGSTLAGRAIRNAVLEAKENAGLRGIMPEAAVVALAAIDSRTDRHVTSRLVRRIGIAKTSFVVHDSVAALYAATQGKPGVIVISGTGSVAAGINERAEYVRVGGWGYLIDDEGSGFDIGRRALTAAFRTVDGRIPRTKLTGILKRRFKVESLEEINTIYAKGWSVEEIAGLARLVTTAANTDKVCRNILKQAGISLAELAVTVAKRLRMRRSKFPVATVGGNFKSGRLLLGPFTARVKLECPKAYVRRLDIEPASGAFWLAARLNSPYPSEFRIARRMAGDLTAK